MIDTSTDAQANSYLSQKQTAEVQYVAARTSPVLHGRQCEWSYDFSAITDTLGEK